MSDDTERPQSAPRPARRKGAQRLLISGALLCGVCALVLSGAITTRRVQRIGTGGASLTPGLTPATNPAHSNAVAAVERDATMLLWEDLRRAVSGPDGTPRAPEDLRRLEGRRVCVRGFLLPVHTATASSELFVAASPGGCFFCSPPGPADVVMVLMAGGKKVSLEPYAVSVSGRLKLATGSGNDTALYTLLDGEVAFNRQ